MATRRRSTYGGSLSAGSSGNPFDQLTQLGLSLYNAKQQNAALEQAAAEQAQRDLTAQGIAADRAYSHEAALNERADAAALAREQLAAENAKTAHENAKALKILEDKLARERETDQLNRKSIATTQAFRNADMLRKGQLPLVFNDAFAGDVLQAYGGKNIADQGIGAGLSLTARQQAENLLKAEQDRIAMANPGLAASVYAQAEKPVIENLQARALTSKTLEDVARSQGQKWKDSFYDVGGGSFLTAPEFDQGTVGRGSVIPGIAPERKFNLEGKEVVVVPGIPSQVSMTEPPNYVASVYKRTAPAPDARTPANFGGGLNYDGYNFIPAITPKAPAPAAPSARTPAAQPLGGIAGAFKSVLNPTLNAADADTVNRILGLPASIPTELAAGLGNVAASALVGRTPFQMLHAPNMMYTQRGWVPASENIVDPRLRRPYGY